MGKTASAIGLVGFLFIALIACNRTAAGKPMSVPTSDAGVTPIQVTVTSARATTATGVPSGDNQSTEPCPVSPITTDRPANSNTANWASNWYRSSDSQIWASAAGLRHVGFDKVLWAKPEGSHLEVQGRRLDGVARPLRVDLPCCYDEFDYQASGITFPTAGCWEIEARANNTVWRFVVRTQ